MRMTRAGQNALDARLLIGCQIQLPGSAQQRTQKPRATEVAEVSAMRGLLRGRTDRRCRSGLRAGRPHRSCAECCEGNAKQYPLDSRLHECNSPKILCWMTCNRL